MGEDVWNIEFTIFKHILVISNLKAFLVKYFREVIIYNSSIPSGSK